MISGIFCIEMAFPLCASICAVSAVGLFWNFFSHISQNTLGCRFWWLWSSIRQVPAQRLLWWPCPLLWALGRENHQAQFNPGSCTPDGCRSCAKSSEGGSLHFAWEWQEAGWYLSPKLGWGKRCCSWCNGHQPTAAGDRGGGSYNTRSQPWLRFWQKNEGSCWRLPEVAFIPLAFESLGGWNKTAEVQVKRIAQALARQTCREESECVSKATSRLSLLLMKGNAAILTNRIPSAPDPHNDGVLWWPPFLLYFFLAFLIDYHHLYDNNCQ